MMPSKNKVYSSSSEPETVLTENDLVAISVKETNEDGTEGKLLASGLFKGNHDFNGLSIILKHKVKYVVESTVIIGGNEVSKTDDGVYGAPFNRKLTNDNWTINPVPFIDLANQSAIKTNGLVQVDRWYCNTKSIGNYVTKKLSIPLKRVSFRVNYKLENIDPMFMFKCSLRHTQSLRDEKISSDKSIIYTCYNIKEAYDFAVSRINLPLDTDLSKGFEDVVFSYEAFLNNGKQVLSFNNITFKASPNYSYNIKMKMPSELTHSVYVYLGDKWEEPIDIN